MDRGGDKNMGASEGENGNGKGSDVSRSGSSGKSHVYDNRKEWDVLSRKDGRRPGLELGEGLGELLPVCLPFWHGLLRLIFTVYRLLIAVQM